MQFDSKKLKLNCLVIQQNKTVPLFVFGIDGRLVHHICSVSEAKRSQDGTLAGYQRPAVEKHIRSILEYLSGPSALLPNALVIAFDSRTKIERIPGAQPSEWGAFAEVSIPLPRNGSETKAGWIVDGQQRATALARIDPTRSFPVAVVGFLSDDQALQREQFVRVNKTKPLPKDLLIEILPEMDAAAPRDLEKKQLAARVLKRIRFDATSPFFGRIRALGVSEEGANISQSAVISVIQGSIQRRGVLFDYCAPAGEQHDIAKMAHLIMVFFEGVRRTWPQAWEGGPSTSRLVHGAGIVAMGYLMDRVMIEVDANSQKAASTVANRLQRLQRRCAWTSGTWPKLGIAWNEIQNTSQDKAKLTEFLLREYSAK